MDLDAKLISRDFPTSGKVLVCNRFEKSTLLSIKVHAIINFVSMQKAEIEAAPALPEKNLQKNDDCGTNTVQNCFTFHEKENRGGPKSYLYTIHAVNVSISRNVLSMVGDGNQSYNLRHGGFSNIGM